MFSEKVMFSVQNSLTFVDIVVLKKNLWHFNDCCLLIFTFAMGVKFIL